MPSADPNRAPSTRGSRRDVGRAGTLLRQSVPFESDSHEALLTVMLVAEQLHGRYEPLFADRDLTRQQYNVLRILRGAGASGLPTLEIADRMIERTPGISRLIDRLVKKDLVVRERCEKDRRQVFCRISDAGRTLLSELDVPIRAMDDASMAGLSKDEKRQLIRLLNKALVERA
ncbi:MAG: MarR family transcriptional regulator [Planctomycetota bacterium]